MATAMERARDIWLTTTLGPVGMSNGMARRAMGSFRARLRQRSALRLDEASHCLDRVGMVAQHQVATGFHRDEPSVPDLTRHLDRARVRGTGVIAGVHHERGNQYLR